MVDFFGQFHPILVHFTVVLPIFILLYEVMLKAGFNRLVDEVDEASRFAIVLSSLAAALTAFLGWCASNIYSQTDTLFYHQWLGTTVAIYSFIVAIGVLRINKWWWQMGLVTSLVLLTGIAAHFGGILVHGEFRF